MSTKVKHPKTKNIAGWYLGDKTETDRDIATSNVTAAKAQRVVAWVKQWAAYVAQEEKAKKKDPEGWFNKNVGRNQRF